MRWTALACLAATVAACGTAREPSPQQALGPASEEPITMPAADVARLAYVTAVARRGDVRLDILAGALLELHEQAPALSQAQLAAATAQIVAVIAAHPIAEDFDAGDAARAIGRRLARIVPDLGTSAADDALRAYASAYLAARRSDVDELRKVSPAELLDDVLGRGESFRLATWTALHARAQAGAALAGAIDAGPIGAALGVSVHAAAGTVLAAHPVQPLHDFYQENKDASGGITTSLGGVQALVTAAGDIGIARSRAIADNLFALTRAEQLYVDDNPSMPGLPDQRVVDGHRATTLDLDQFDQEDLKNAIARAEALHTSLKETLGDVKSGVNGALWAAAALARQSNDPAFAAFAADIELFGKAVVTCLDNIVKYTDTAIQGAKVLADLFDVGQTGFKVIGAAIFTGGMIATAFQIVSLFGQSPQQSVDPTILAEVLKLRDLVKDVRREMNLRFDRVDRKLDAIYSTMVQQFELVDWNLGVLNENVEEVQSALYGVQVNLDRIDRNVYAFLDAIEREPLVNGIAGWLGYRERLGVDLSLTDFGIAENLFFTWAKFTAADAVQAGPAGRLFDDASLLSELNYPLATNINYLREMPPLRLGAAPLASGRLANPLTWIVAAESYAQLGEEWPAYALTVNPTPIDPAQTTRLARLVGTGEDTAGGLDAIASAPLVNGLATLYEGRFTALMTAIADFEAQFEADPNHSMKGTHLWAGTDQAPNDHYLMHTQNLRSCRIGRDFDGRLDLPVELTRWSHAAIAPFIYAGALGVRALDACIYPDWILYRTRLLPGGREMREFRLRVAIRGHASGETVETHTFWTDKSAFRYDRQSDPILEPEESPERETAHVWNTIYNYPTTYKVDATAAQLTAVRDDVRARLVLLQRRLYSQIAAKLSQAGDPLADAGRALSGVQRLWGAYGTLGFPVTLAQNDLVRGRLFGNEAVLAGTDVGDQNGFLDDVQDLYAYFSSADEVPGENLRSAVTALGTARNAELRDALLLIVERLAQTGEREGRELLLPTLTRLRLLDAAIH
ncbi:MAG TPA: hypothetical protein VNO30_00905 [Kofleriaceae bacterium]|nr:hypothetical protein [Kofleriaceae bacterium]